MHTRPSLARSATLILLLAACAAPPPVTEADGAPLLPGAAADPAIAALPDLPIEPAPEEEVVDYGAIRMVPHRLGLGLTPEATVGEVNALADALDFSVVGTLPALGLVVVETDSRDVDWLDRALDLADASPAIAVASPAVVGDLDLLPPFHRVEGSDWTWEREEGANWGLSFVGAPQGWNVRAAVDAPEVPLALVIDEAFDPDHPDVRFDADTPSTSSASSFHGVAVAGAMAATWDAAGIETIFPAGAGVSDWGVTVQGRTAGDTFVNLRHLALAIGEAERAGRPLVANYSSGKSFVPLAVRDGQLVLTGPQQTPSTSIRDALGTTGTITPTATIAEIVARESVFVQWFSGKVAYERWLLTASTGNDNLTAAAVTRLAARGVVVTQQEILAEHNSAFSHAATVGDDDHFIAVTALDPGGRIGDYSSRKGNLSAPGTDVGVLSDGGYGELTGTSFAAPLVGSAAMWLWTLDPDATPGEIKAALIEGAQPSVGVSDPRLDVVGAMRALLDEAAWEEVELVLADLDDGSVDGNLRIRPSGGVATIVPMEDRGDGCVDMADFRAFRDGLLDALQAETGGHRGFWEERDSNRDQNGDGRVQWIEGAHEGRHSRMDLNLDGEVDLRDLEVLERQWGRCEAGAGPARLEGRVAADLAGLIDSVDLWIDADLTGTGASVLTAPGRFQLRLTEAVLAERSLDGHVLVTLPTSACDGALNLRIRTGDAVRRFRSPPVEALARARDYIINDAVLDDVVGASKVPVAYRQGGGGRSELLVYEGGRLAFAFEDFEMPYRVGPVAPSGAVQVAMPASGRGKVAVVIDGIRTVLEHADAPRLTPWEWAADGSGFLARPTDFEGGLYWADTEGSSLVEVAPSIDKAWGDWPAVHEGYVVFMGADGGLYRASLKPRQVLAGEALEAEIREDARVCEDAVALDDVEQIADLSGLDGVGLAHTLPSPVSSWGHILLRARRGDAWDLSILKAGESTPIALVSGVDLDIGTTDLFPVDGTSWSYDSAFVSYADEGGVWVADLKDGAIPEPDAITTRKLHDASGFAVFDPFASLTVAIQSFMGPWHSPDSTVTTYSAHGGEPLATYAHSPRCGSPSWSERGGTLVLAQKPADGVRWDARPGWASRFESKPGFFSDCDVVWVEAEYQKIVDDTAIEVYTTGGGGEAMADEAFPSWGVDFAR